MSTTKFDARQSVLRSALPMIGNSANAQLDTVLGLIDPELSKLYEDRNITLVDGGLISFNSAGTSLSFSTNLRLHINSQVAGGSPTVIDLGATSRTLSANNRMVYAVINRTGGTAVITADAATLPSVVAANQEVVLIAKRSDSGDGTKRVYFRNGFTLSSGQSSRLGSTNILYGEVVTDSTTTGATATLAAFIAGVVRLTNGSLTSVSGIPAGSAGQFLMIENQTGNSIVINNNDGGATAANRIFTGTSANVTVGNNATLDLVYDSTQSKWMLSSAGTTSATNIVTVTTTYTRASTDDYIIANPAGNVQFTITLDSAATAKPLRIRKKDSDLRSVITISTVGGDLFSFNSTTSGSTTLNSTDEEIYLIPSGTTWIITSRTYDGSWHSYASDLSGWTRATSPVLNKQYWRRSGASLHLLLQYRQNSSVGATNPGLQNSWGLPLGATVDSNVVDRDQVTNEGAIVGEVQVDKDGTFYHGWAYPRNSDNTQISMIVGNDTTAFTVIGSGFLAVDTGSITQYTVTAIVPITGWN